MKHKGTRTARTINRYFGALRRILNLAIADGLLSANPIKGVKFFSEPAGRLRFLNDKEISSLRDTLPPEHWLIVAKVTPSEENRYELAPLHDLTRRIAAICKLGWFTTEIALTHDDFVVVDYVNDEIDTRIQSKVDGAPDGIMQSIASQLVTIAKENQ